MANPAEEIKVKKDNMTITVTKKAFDSYYSFVGYKEVKSRRTMSDKSE
ncbi:hypothetical protein QI536_12925 [Staphylococcus aureus]|nr:hypothetical protein [Staphylococcus aureus]